MASRTESKTRTRNEERKREESAFSWASDNAGPLIGAAAAGAAIVVAANVGRKLISQGWPTSGEWDETLASEHDAALEIFDRMLATDETQTFKRNMLLMKLTHALDRHAHAEEMIIYPALREANATADADHLESEHGYVKTFLFELSEMGPGASNWLERVREFRDLVREHAHMEEEQVFPKFRKSMTEKQNAHITSLMKRDEFWMS